MKNKKILLLPIISLICFGCNNDYDEPESIWPEEIISNLVKSLDDEIKDVIPSFNDTNEIEIDTENLEEEGYFGIYCYTNDEKADQKYSTILKNNGWDVSDTMIEGFWEAYSPNDELWLNYMYSHEYGDLEIYVTIPPIIDWPSKKIAEYVNLIVSNTKTIIPSFEAELYTVNYYPDFKGLAINGYGVEANIVSTYKNSVENAHWFVKETLTEGEYDAISPNEDIQINFYYDAERQEFNVDVLAYKKIKSEWPAEEIAEVVKFMGATGTVPKFEGNATGYAVDCDWEPYGILVYVANGTQESSANAYNQQLLNLGFVKSTEFLGLDFYSYPGTTLALRASYLEGQCFIIEMLVGAGEVN